MTIQAPMKKEYMVNASMNVLIAKNWHSPLRNVGVYSDPAREAWGETSDEVYSNWRTKRIKNGDLMNLNVSLHEINPEILAIIDWGAVEYEQEVATVTDRLEKFMVGQWWFDRDVILSSRNADGTAITPTVKILLWGVETTLTSWTDYNVGVTAIGDTYITFIQGTNLPANAPAEWVINVTYSCTPDATLQKIKHFQAWVPSGFVMVLEEKWTVDWKDVGIRFKLEDCKNVKGFHTPVNDADDLTSWYPCQITGTVIGHEFFGFGE